MNPLDEQPLETRADFQQAVVRLFEPIESNFSPGRARVKLGETGAWFPDVAAELEGFSRPLWALAPLAAGGGTFDRWSLYRTGLANGSDPDHPEYWGDAGDYAQRHVEMAAIGFSLVLAPEKVWEPLDPAEKENLVAWLNQINDASLYDCNWLFFRVVVNLGLRAVDAEHDWEATQAALDRLESFYLGDGWYSDGPEGERPCDHYIAWAMHTYGLMYAAIVDDERAERFRERASTFATEYAEWFQPDGAGLPYGRSLTYRFAQATFWGALAFAEVEALPWGVIRGLWARNVRWWADQPIFTDGGVLSIGYRYPTLKMSESYNSPGSPYWAMKAFLPLALPSDHPFWQAGEQPLPDRSEPSVSVQPKPKMVLCRDEDADHHFALTTGQNSQYLEKYTKFAYSTEFGFSVRSRRPELAGAGHDNMLALSDDGDTYRIRLSIAESKMDGSTLYSRWEPWDDVTVESWLAPATPWHVRVHRIETGRSLHSAEGGFPLGKVDDDKPDSYEHQVSDSSARVTYPTGSSGIRDLRERRNGDAVSQDPNTNLIRPRTIVPTLTATHDPGIHWVVSAVTAASGSGDDAWQRAPRLDLSGDTAVIADANGSEILRCDETAPGDLDRFV